MITTAQVHLDNAHKTPQFWLLWLVLCLNVSAGIGIIGAASPMLQETFGGALIGRPELGFADIKKDAALAAQAAGVAAGFVGLISLFNIFGRIGWASSSDVLGRKLTYFIFFVLGAGLYVLATQAADWKSLALFVACFCIIASMYGGGFATIPAYLADMFGTQFVGAIHGRLLTAWSTAGIVGPVIVNYLHDTRQAEGIPSRSDLWADLLHPCRAAGRRLRRQPARSARQSKETHDGCRDRGRKHKSCTRRLCAGTGSFGIGKGGLDAKAVAFWLLVLIPLGWGIWITVQKAVALFG